MEGEKRGMGLNEYNGDMRKAGRGGGAGAVFRPPGSKEVGACEPGPYYDKVVASVTSESNGNDVCCICGAICRQFFQPLSNLVSFISDG